MSRVLLRRVAVLDHRDQVVAHHLVHTGDAGVMPDLLAATNLAAVSRGLPLLLEVAGSDLGRVVEQLDGFAAQLVPADAEVDDLGPWKELPDGISVVARDPVGHPGHAALLPIASHVLIDASRLDVGEITDRYRHRDGKPAIVVGVHRSDLARHVRALGDVALSGRYLSDVDTSAGTVLEGDRLTLLQLVSMLQEQAPAPAEVTAVVQQSPTLSYELLRWVNSAAVGLRRTVDDLGIAVSLLGPARIRQVVSLMLTRELSNRPAELSRTALMRARMAEQLGAALGDDRPGHYVVGLFSMLDALMECPLDSLVEQLPLTEEIVGALLHHEGRYGRVLQMCKLYEHAQFDDPALEVIDPDVLSTAYLDAMVYADGVLGAVAVAG